MSNSTTNLDLLSASQANKEVTVNAALDAASPAMLYGRRASTSAALTFGYYGGTVMIGSTPTQIANGTVTLAASATNYVEADPATGAVSVNQTGFTAGRTPLYQVVTVAATVTSYTDLRVLGGSSSGTVKSVNTKTPDSSGAVTLTATDVGADASGAASSAVSAHVAASDPHPQYMTQAESDARYAALGNAVTDGDKGDIVVSGSGSTYAIDPTVLSTFGRTLADDADAATARTTLGLGTSATLNADTDTTLAANSDTRLATQKAVKAYVDGVVTGGAAGVMVFKGAIDCSANPNYPAASAGAVYKVSVAGRLGGVTGVVVEVGDTAYCTATAASGDQATVGGSWNVVQENIDGAVVGPSSATDNHVAMFNGPTGKLIKDSGLTLSGTNTGDETATTTGALIHGATAKTTLVDADEMDLTDSAASFVMKKITWANVKATLKSYFDTLYAVFGETVNAQAGTSYTYLNSDMGKLVTHSNAAAIAGTLPQAGSGGSFAASWWVDVQNRGAGTLTITPTTSKIDGASTLALTAGQGVRIVSDGTNYFTQRGCGGSSGGGTPGGSTTQVQFNDGGAFAGATTLLWDKTNNILTLGSGTSDTLTIKGANGSGTNTGSNVLIKGGVGAGGLNGGKVSLYGGDYGSGSSKAGGVEIYGCDPIRNYGGDITIKGGGIAGDIAGATTISGGDGKASGTGGPLLLNGGDGPGGYRSGSATLRGGDSTGNGGTGGDVTVRGGYSFQSSASANTVPGNVAVTGGAATGNANTATGGTVTIKGGQGGSIGGDGGGVSISGGSPQAGNGGAVSLTGAAGVGTNKNGGNITLTPGTATGTGTPGNVVLNGSGAALATTAIGGFTCIPTCAGAPTGVPANIPAGTVPMVFDSTNKKLWMYVASSWVGVVLS